MPYNPIALTPSPLAITPDSVTVYAYTNKDDTLATIKAAGYFDINFPSTDNNAAGLKIADRITIDGADGSQELKVDSVFPVITVSGSSSEFSIIASFKGQADDGLSTTAFAVPGMLSTDQAFASLISSMLFGLEIDKVTPANNELFVKFSAAAGSNTFVSILVTR